MNKKNIKPPKNKSCLLVPRFVQIHIVNCKILFPLFVFFSLPFWVWLGWVCLLSVAEAQNIGINTMGAAGHSSAMLDIASTNAGLLIPRLTTAQRNAIASPANSLLIFNTTDNCLQIYNANQSQWENAYCFLGCSSAPATPGSITGNSSPCQNAAGVIYSIVQVAGATSYNWTIPAGASITVGQGTTGIVVTWGTTSGNVSVTASNNCGTSAAQTLAVALQTVPAQPSAISGNPTVCQGDAGVVYSVTNDPGVTYSWTYSGTGWTCASGCATNSITVNYSGSATSGTLSVTPSNACGSGTAQTLAITVNAPPAQPSAISGNSTVCQGNSGVGYSVTNVSGVTYTWTYSGTGYTVATGQGTNSITANYSGSATSGTITVTPSNTCGTGTAQTLAVTVNSTPSGSQAFSYTGGVQNFTVPTCVSSITIKSWGAGGGGGGGSANETNGGGGSAYSTVSVSVNPGDILQIYVGGGGGGGGSNFNVGGGEAGSSGWGYGTGGQGGSTPGDIGCSGGGGGGGGGSSAVYNQNTSTLLIVAAGGGGSGGQASLYGGGAGGGGGQNGGNGGVGNCLPAPPGGTAGGSGTKNGTPGGSTGGCDYGAGGGGGGGNTNGGTGGSNATCFNNGGGGGGGGNSLGTVTTGGSPSPGNGGDPDLCGGCAVGGQGGKGGNYNGSSGGNGFVKITW